jgi:hypothetical protein
MKRFDAGATLVALSLLLLAVSPAVAQKSPHVDAPKFPQRMPYDLFDRSRPDRDHIAPPPPVIPSAPAPPLTMRPATLGVPSREFQSREFQSREFRLPPDRSSSPFDAGPYTYAPRYGARSRPLRPYGYGGYGSGWPYYATGNYPVGGPNLEAQTAVADVESLGRLFLDVDPPVAQVVVDGVAAGTVADFRGVGVLLTAGPRHVELRSPGYESTTFDINIVTNQPAVYRGGLTPLRKVAEAGAPALRRGSDTVYVIPGCYAGNRPPRAGSLPPGCDIKRARTVS